MRQQKQQTGFSTLEFAAVLPVILGFVMGALAVGRMFQARNVLDEGLRESLRCLKSTDGCRTSNFVPPNKFYDWYEVTKPVKYEINKFRYSGKGYWIDQPNYLIPLSARLVTGVQATYAQSVRTYKPVLREVVGGVLAFIVTSRGPYITGDNALNPRFRYRQRRDFDYPAFQVENLDSIAAARGGAVKLHASKGRNDTRVVSFTTPRQPRFNGQIGKRCYPVVEDQMDLPIGSALLNVDFADDCSHLASKDGVQVTLHLTGQSHGNGKLSAKLRWLGNDGKWETQEIGGRSFSGPGWGNFVPRGAVDKNYVDDDIRPRVTDETKKYTEFNLYQKIILPFQTNVDLELTLELQDSAAADERTEWDGDQLKIYSPKFTLGFLERRCKGMAVKPSEVEAIRAANVAEGFGEYRYPSESCWIVQEKNVETGQDYAKIPAEYARINPTSDIAGAELMRSKAALSEREHENNLSELGLKKEDYVFVGEEPIADTITVSRKCTGRLSVAEEPGAGGVLRESQRAALECPVVPTSTEKTPQAQAALIQRVKNAGNPNPISIEWKEEELPLIGEDRTWVKSTCSDQFMPPSIDGILPQKLIVKEKKLLPQYTALYLPNGQDPRVAIKSATYSCEKDSDFKLGERIIAWEPAEDSTTISSDPFVGDQPDIGPKCVYERLKNAVPETVLNRDAYFVPDQPIGPVGVQILDKPLTNDCDIPHRIVYGEGGNDILLTTSGPLAEGVKPEKCKEEHAICRAVLAKMQGSDTQMAELEAESLRLAKERGMQAIQAAMPGIPECNENNTKNCYQFKIDKKIVKDPDQQKTVYVGDASVEVGIAGVHLGKINAHKEALAEINFVR